MTKKSLTGILSGLSAVVVFSVIFLLIVFNCIISNLDFPLNDYWIELLINYSAGPIRRGLPGELLGNITFIPTQTLWLAILVICYVFIFAVLALRMRKLGIPFFMQIGIYLSPLLCFCLYNSYYFVNRDIVLLAGVLLVLLPISSVWRHGEKADTRSLALCSVFLTVIGSVLLFSHVASCTLLVLPLLLMMLLSRNAVDFILFSLLPAIVFLAEIFIIQKFMSVLSPDGMMVLLDDIKSRYPVVPGRMDDSILVVLRSLGAEGQEYWRGVTARNLENLPAIFSEAAFLMAVAILPAVLVMFRRAAGAGSPKIRTLRISAVIIASLAPMALTFVACDYFRWRNWAFFMLLSSVLLLGRDAAVPVQSEDDLTARAIRIRYAAAYMISCVAASVVLYELSAVVPAMSDALDQVFNLSGRYGILQINSPEEKKMITDIHGENWSFIGDSGQTVSDIGTIRKLDRDEQSVTSLCFGAMIEHSFDRKHRRLFMRGYQLVRVGEGKFSRPPRSFGFIVSDSESSFYYPTVAYAGMADINGYQVRIGSMYDDYAVIPSYMNMEKLKVYHAMYNLKGKIIRCSEPVLELGGK